VASLSLHGMLPRLNSTGNFWGRERPKRGNYSIFLGGKQGVEGERRGVLKTGVK